MPENNQRRRPTIMSHVAAGRMPELRANARRAAPLLKAMGNPSRLILLCRIAEGECSVSEMQRAIRLSQSGISQHLALLRRQGVVTARREGQAVFYSLSSPGVATIMATLQEVFCTHPGRQAARR
ncbi:MAG TPA: metalloregulator ArsR/SmtB family transcription factor [Usitatibacter sp.]|jgi:DNA-binding transcriptional ArsR family regulator|nr:metalloregulator ArsR/SmtB family transcription factor [Usitatibacter sp.]